VAKERELFANRGLVRLVMKSSNKNLLIHVLLVGILVFNEVANAQTSQNFDALLSAYVRAKSEYAAVAMMQPGGYWSEQYLFYRSKIERILQQYDDAAYKNPQAFCLKALRMYSKYLRADSSVGSPFVTDNSMFIAEFMYNLSEYCSRYGIHYNPYEERME